MPISAQETKRLMIATTSSALGNSLADAINLGEDLALQSSHSIAAVIIATNVSATVDFAALRVGDQVLIAPAAAGNAQFVTVATLGTLPQAAVVGSLYVVLRARAVPAASNEKF